tara:strand:+ start:1578 stop:2120 length:543 start_codon:yes stop_codon:yes gene_type:complete
MSSDELNLDEIDQDTKNKEMLLEIFFNTKGSIDDINAEIDKKLFGKKIRNITLFDKYIRARLALNSKVLSLVGQEITPVEAAYLSQYPGLENVEKLDLRKNRLGDEGLEVLLNSKKIRNIKDLDLRNNQITRQGMILLSETKNLLNLECLDLRVNKLGKKWEEKLKDKGKFPKLSQLRIA